MKILYDTTYCFRGNSGVPRDAISLARILSGPELNSDLLFFPKHLISTENEKINGQNIAISDAIRGNPGRDAFPSILRLALTFYKAFTRRKKVKIFQVNEMLHRVVTDALKISKQLEGNVLISNLSSIERWARPKFRGLFLLPTKNYDLFIQQQIDPIRVSRKTKHVVRLHDIIPVTHPEFFDHQAVSLFTSGLTRMLAKSNIYWIMDTKANLEEFRNIFGHDIQGSWVPCVIDSKFTKANMTPNRKNQILVLGTLEPRKRVEWILNAFLICLEDGKISSDWQLIVAGGMGWQSDVLTKRLLSPELNSSIVFIQSPTDNEILSLMSVSKILVSASYAEGFGLPPLEALAMGMSVVATAIPQHRETMGDRVAYFETEQGLIEQLTSVANDDSNFDVARQFERRQFVLSKYSEIVIAKQWIEILNQISEM
jgi:glycosyltransferase involved in cell wall biosynthesis